MFSKLRNRIIIITMTITTVVLVLAGGFIMLVSSATRPEPKAFVEIISMNTNDPYNDQKFREYVNSDREEGNIRLLVTLICVGVIVEIAAFVISYYFSEKIVEPVQDAYDKQKLFIANASHELKTPLAVIQANMEALDVDKNNEKWKDNIENEITHANKLVLDLLQLAKMDAENIDTIPAEKIDLATEIEKHVEVFKPRFSGKINLKMNESAKEYLLPKQDVFQVLDILLDNAIKYGDKKVSITLTQNELVVTNDGATIEKKDLEKIFDRFYQTDKTREGSGLGLAIAKAICDKNGWKIRCESTKSTTKFIVDIL